VNVLTRSAELAPVGRSYREAAAYITLAPGPQRRT
jgi:hypothetical protein